MPKTARDPADYILPLYMNRLEGRMLHLPAPRGKSREIVFVYGQHSSLERWWGVAEAFNKYGAVTIPDLPGFGGMTPLYRIGQQGNIDNLADYLAAFFKLKYKRKNVTVVGMSLGFVIVTRMLQKYPELTKKIDLLISVVGFTHHDDFVFSKGRVRAYRYISFFSASRLISAIYRATFLQPAYLRRAYKHSRFAKEKLSHLTADEIKKTMDAELVLWRINDIRTQMRTNHEMMKLDNTKTRVDLPLWHVASKKDRYFDHNKAEASLRRVYSDLNVAYTTDPNHAPTIIADAKAAAPFIPPQIRALLRKKP